MFKLPHNCTHLTCQQSNAQNSPSQASTVHEPRISRCSGWISKRQRNQKSNCQPPLDHRQINLLCLFTMLKILTFCITTNWKIVKEMGMPDHLTCLLRNLFACQEATGITIHGTTNWFQIGTGVQQACILSPCLFNLYAEYIMQNARLDEAQTGIKIVGRNITKLICR